jgi:hypothetical protein
MKSKKSASKRPAKNKQAIAGTRLSGRTSGLGLSLHDMNVISLATQSPASLHGELLKAIKTSKASPHAIDIVKIVLASNASSSSKKVAAAQKKKDSRSIGTKKAAKTKSQSVKALIARNYLDWASRLGD